MSHEPAKQIPGLEDYPKMVYPEGHSVSHTNAGSHEVADFAGVIVQNEDEEKWVRDGNKMADFGKEPKEEKKPVGWTADPKATK